LALKTSAHSQWSESGNNLSAELREQHLDILEKNLVETEEEIKALQIEIDELELARQEHEYKTYHGYLQNFKKGNKTLHQYENITQDDLSNWKTQQGELEQQREDEQTNQEALSKYQGELDKLKAEKENHVSVRDAQQSKQNNYNPVLSPILDTHAKASEKLSRAETFKPIAIKGALGLGIILVVVFLAYLLEPLFLKLLGYSLDPRVPVLLIWIVGGLFIIALALFLWWAIILSMINHISQRLLIKAADYGFKAETISQLRAILSDFGEQLDQKESLVRQAEDNVRLCINEIQGIERELDRLKERRRKVEEMISDIRQKANVESLDAYAKRLEKKQKVVEQVNNAKSLLIHQFGDFEGTDEKKEEYWQSKLEDLKPERSPTQKYDAIKLGKAKDKQQDLIEEEKSIQQSLKNNRDKLSETEAEVNEVLSPFLEESSKIIIESSNDLDVALTRLEAFVKEAEDRRDNSQIALNVLDSLAQREEERVSSLFGEDSDVSKVFFSFTHGDYTTVRYIPDKQAIEVNRRDGITLEPLQLSGGTYDQLYLAIRVALAKKVLGEDKGFFLFDDPFVKSDPDRLQIQITNLWELVQDGWQVVYFSTKPEVREKLDNLLTSRDCQILELPPAPFKQDSSL